MADPLEIYTNGDMAFMEAILTGLGHVYNDGFLGPIFGMALLANCLMSLMRFIADSKNGFLTSFWQAIVLYLIMFSSTTNIVLTKEGEGTRSIAGDFPIGVVAPAYFISMIGTKIAERFRQNIVVIDAGWGSTSNTAILDYGLSPLEILMKIRTQTVSGMFEKSDLLSDIGNPDGGGSGLGVAIGTYHSYCIEKAVKLADLDPDGMSYVRKIKGAKVATDYWEALKIDEPWPITLDLDGVMTTTTCSNAHTELNARLKKRAEEIQKAAIFGLSSDDASITATEEYQRIVDFYDAIDPINGASAISKLSSNLYTSVMNEGACKDSVLMGPEFVQACATQWDSIQGRRIAEASKADSFMEMLIPMVTFIEGFVFIISPFMILMVLFTGAGGLKMMGKYLTALLWVTLIPVCQVAVDVYLNTYFNRFLFAMQQDGAGTSLSSIYAQESVWTDLESFIAFAGTAQAMVPALAMFIIFAGVHTLQGMGAGMASGAAVDPSKLHANKAVGIKDGNFSYGQISAVEARNDYGSNVGGEIIQASSSKIDSSASDYKLGVNSKDSYAQKVAASQSYASTLGSDVGKRSDDTFGRDYTTTDNYDIKDGISAGASQAAATTMSHAEVLQKQYGFSQQGAEKVATAIQASGGVGVQYTQDFGGAVGKLVDAVTGAKLQASFKGEAGASIKDEAAFQKMMDEKDSSSTTASMMHDASERVEDAYKVAAESSAGVGYKEGYSEKELAYFQASQKYAEQVGKTETLERAGTSSVDRSASAGTFPADAAVSQKAMRSVLDGSNVEEFRNDILGSMMDGKTLNSIRSMDSDDRNALFNSLTQAPAGMNNVDPNSDEGKQLAQEYENRKKLSDHLEAVGIGKDLNGDWKVDSDSKYKSELVGLSQDQYEARVASDRTQDSRSSRQDLLRNFMNGVDDVRNQVGMENEKEAMIAAGNLFDRMSESGSGSVQGVDDGLAHGQLKAFAGEYKDAAERMVDVDTSYNEFLQDSGLKKFADKGAEINDVQLNTGELSDLQDEIKGLGKHLIDTQGSKVVENYRDTKGSVSTSIMNSLFDVDGGVDLSSMKPEERLAALQGIVGTKTDDMQIKSDAAQEQRDTHQASVEKGLKSQEMTGLNSDDNLQELAQAQFGDKNTVEYSADEIKATNSLKTEMGELHEATKYFDTEDAKMAFSGMSDEQIAVFDSYVSGGEATREQAVAAFEGQAIHENANLGDMLQQVRDEYGDVKELEANIKQDLGSESLNKAYVGAEYLENNDFEAARTSSSQPYVSHGGGRLHQTDEEKREEVAGVMDLSKLSTSDELSLWGTRVTNSVKKMFE